MTHRLVCVVCILSAVTTGAGCADDGGESIATDTADATDTTDTTDHDVPDVVDTGDTRDAPDSVAPEDTSPPREHGLEERVVNTTCRVDGAPPLAIVPVAIEPAFPSLDAPGARALTPAPASGRLALADRDGHVRTFEAAGDGGDAETTLDLSASCAPDGLRGAALRPDGRALVVAFVPNGAPTRLVIARFPIDPTSGLAAVEGREDLLTVALSDATRAGGALAFLFDGTLVVAVGDGGDPAAPLDPTSLLGKALRLDVSGPAGSGAAIPDDNPFVAREGVRPEVLASGLGAPTSCAVDRVVGRLWCADAGGASKGTLLIVAPAKEPDAPLSPLVASAPAGALAAGCGVVVGTTSRDTTLPDIQGAVVYGDTCSPVLRAFRFDGALVRSDEIIATLPAPLRALGEDADGHQLAVDADGAVHRLVRPATAPPEFPATVSATGCFELPSGAPAPSLVPYEVLAPLWSDGAIKRRYIALPGEATIGFTEVGAWTFPDGTLLAKEFLLDDDQDPATAPVLMETRFLKKDSDTAWEGYSYMWDRERRDAFLLEGAEIGTYPMAPGAVDDGGASVHLHTFPSRSQCLLCHNAGAGRALGPQTGRMNTEHDYDGFVENQLAAMDHIGLFGDPLPASPEDLPRFPDPRDESAPLEGRARAWLYANCAHCHTPGGSTPVAVDLRYETPLADTHTCGLTPKYRLSQLPDASIITPGDADGSELFFRLARRDGNQMPPIATLILDDPGVDVVRRWIDGLGECPPPAP
ncbi:MAG: hypothetical protein EP329_17295 [Deltaproteobacteria bacterium]|nr:MAG: hypothetical protein EP329_17295 [Deltaproteobacteria bacterium]